MVSSTIQRETLNVYISSRHSPSIFFTMEYPIFFKMKPCPRHHGSFTVFALFSTLRLMGGGFIYRLCSFFTIRSMRRGFFYRLCSFFHASVNETRVLLPRQRLQPSFGQWDTASLPIQRLQPSFGHKKKCLGPLLLCGGQASPIPFDKSAHADEIPCIPFPLA